MICGVGESTEPGPGSQGSVSAAPENKASVAWCVVIDSLSTMGLCPLQSKGTAQQRQRQLFVGPSSSSSANNVLTPSGWPSQVSSSYSMLNTGLSRAMSGA